MTYWSVPGISNKTIEYVPKTKMDLLIRIICNEYNLPPKDIRKKNNQQPWPEVRKMIAYFALVVLHIDVSTKEVAKALYESGNHSNIVIAVQDLKNQLHRVKNRKLLEKYNILLTSVRLRFPHVFINNN